MKRALLLPLLAIVAFAFPIPVSAQGDQSVPLARRLFNEGVEAAHAKKWDVALDRFARSYEIAPRLKTLFNLAGAQIRNGQLVNGSESYRRFLRETRDGRLPAYRKDARELLADIEKKMPFVTVRVLGLSPGDEVKLNGQTFSSAGLGESMPIDPGAHTVEVRRDGAPIGSKRFSIDESGSKNVEIVIEPRSEIPDEGPMDAKKSSTPGASFAAGNGKRPEDDDEGGSILGSGWFWTAVAVVAIGGAGAVFLTRDLTDDPTVGTFGRGVIDVAP